MTRAKNELTLSHARYRMLRGITERTVRSPFIDELPEEGVERPNASSSPRKRRVQSVPSGQLPDDVEEWTIGTLVRHPDHGVGRILSIHRGGRRTHVDVQFKGGARCSWVLEFADLERVEFDDFG